MDERRYDDDEVSEILARATRDRAPATDSDAPTDSGAPRTGLSLSELRAIGSEAGIDPDRIERAARELDRRVPVEPVRTFLGAPRTVSRAAPLPRPLDDEEWDRLVSELRHTFSATGQVTSQGSLRTWRNGNLQALVEPDGDGWRLRLRTMKANASATGGSAWFFTPVGILLIGLGMFTSSGGSEIAVGSVFTIIGLAELTYIRLTLPGWARERAAQMEQILERAPKLLKE